MINIKNKHILAILALIIIMQTINAYAYSEYDSPLKIHIGKDINNNDVFLYRFSIVDVNKKIKRAVHIVVNDGVTEEYTADYNCSDKSMHTFRVIIKEDSATLEQKPLNINEKMVVDSINAKLLDEVCRRANLARPARRK